MACERYLNAINELVDGTLGPIRRAELELHLETCAACAALAADLRELARAAQALEEQQPPAAVWTNIAEALRNEGRVQSARYSLFARPNHALLALAAALVLVVGASLFLLMRQERPQPAADQAVSAPPVDSGNAVTGPPVQVDTTGLTQKLQATEQSVKDLLDEFEKSPNPPETVAVVRRNLLTVADALEETRKAVEANPDNLAARHSFYEMLRQKIRFLQDTIALMNEMRQGDAAGAAEIVEGGKS